MKASNFLLENYKALGTLWFIEIFEELGEEKFQDTQKEIIKVITEFELSYSRFLESSKITEINRNRKISHPSDEFRTLIEKGLEFYKNTDGVFNFGIADDLTKQGYGKILIDPKEEVKSSNLIDSVIISNDEIKLTNNVTLDLGGFGKGFLVDKLATELRNRFEIRYFLVNGGGDIYVTSDNEEPVLIYLQDPEKSEEYKYSVKLKNCALCGSSTYKRKWVDTSGKARTHIINTNNLSEKIADTSSFVSASTCLIADMIATTICIRSDEEFINKLKESYTFTMI